LKNKVFVDLRLPDLRYNFDREHIDLLMSNLVLTRQDNLPIFRKHSGVYLRTENARHLETWM
jgi:hypothetical protein